jgi:hypothetical protein
MSPVHVHPFVHRAPGAAELAVTFREAELADHLLARAAAGAFRVLLRTGPWPRGGVITNVPPFDAALSARQTPETRSGRASLAPARSAPASAGTQRASSRSR